MSKKQMLSNSRNRLLQAENSQDIQDGLISEEAALKQVRQDLDELALEQSSDNPSHIDFLKTQGFYSGSDVLMLCEQRFCDRYDQRLQGEASIIYQKVQSCYHQIFDGNSLCYERLASGFIRDDGDEPAPPPSPLLSTSPSEAYLQQGRGLEESSDVLISDSYPAVSGPARELSYHYQTLFQENYTQHCRPDSIAAEDSPAAYLSWLYRLATQIDADGVGSGLRLEDRRPDLAGLKLDDATMTQELPTLLLVNEILKQSAQNHIGLGHSITDVLAKTRYPFQLPFDRAWEQIRCGLASYQLDLSTVRQQLSEQGPWYSSGDPQQDARKQGLQISYNEFSTAHYALLLEPYLFTGKENMATALTEQWKRFFLVHYGQSGARSLKEVVAYFSDLPVFLQHTQLAREELEAVLGVDDRWEHISKHCPAIQHRQAMPAQLGASYIHACGAEQESKIVGTEITAWTPRKLERCHRLIRLQRWTGLTYSELNELYVNLLYATQGEPKETKDSFKQYLRLLGVLRYLQRHYPLCSVQHMMAFIYQLSPFGRAQAPAFFDQVFNAYSTETPLVLDDKARNEVIVKQNVDLLCAGLKITRLEWEQLFLWLKEQLQGNIETPDKFNLNAYAVARFYRVVNIPRLFGWKLEEGLLLLDMIDLRCLKQLFGMTRASVPPAIRNDQKTGPDTLDILLAMEGVTRWLRYIHVNPSELASLLATPRNGTLCTSAYFVPDQALSDCFDQLRVDLQGSILTSPVVHPKEYSEKRVLREQYASQWPLLCSALASYFDCSGSLVSHLLVCVDAQYDLLVQLIASVARKDIASIISENGKTLSLLARYIGTVKRLQLSSNFVALWTELPQVLSPDFASVSLDFKVFYLLTRFKDFIESSGGQEGACLDYLHSVQTMPAKQAQSTLAALLKCEDTEIQEILGAEKKATSIAQLDRVLRVRALSLQTHLAAKDLQKAAQLRPEEGLSADESVHSDYQAMASAILAAVAMQA